MRLCRVIGVIIDSLIADAALSCCMKLINSCKRHECSMSIRIKMETTWRSYMQCGWTCWTFLLSRGCVVADTDFVVVQAFHTRTFRVAHPLERNGFRNTAFLQLAQTSAFERTWEIFPCFVIQ